MKQRVFKNEKGQDLIVKHRKSAIIFAVEEVKKDMKPDFRFYFSTQTFKEFASYIEEISNKAWAAITPKEAHSLATDYYEYYDREFDNNGYLSIVEDGLSVEGPYTTTAKLYQFNKSKIQSFIYDLRKKLK